MDLPPGSHIRLRVDVRRFVAEHRHLSPLVGGGGGRARPGRNALAKGALPWGAASRRRHLREAEAVLASRLYPNPADQTAEIARHQREGDWLRT